YLSQKYSRGLKLLQRTYYLDVPFAIQKDKLAYLIVFLILKHIPHSFVYNLSFLLQNHYLYKKHTAKGLKNPGFSKYRLKHYFLYKKTHQYSNIDEKEEHKTLPLHSVFSS